MNDSTLKKDSSTRDSYIVRIYRRDPNDQSKIAGIVETVSVGREDAFKSVEELAGIFTRPIQGISGLDKSNSEEN
jgi:hypothetical protein